jgi:SAM-dependent methyltransferase
MGEQPFPRIAAYYDDLVERYGHDPRSADYGTPISQQRKFRVLAEVCDLDGLDLLDVGCGFADWADHLQARYDGVRYVGLDVSDRMVEGARRLRPHLDVRKGNVLDLDEDERFDVVAANGIFYLLGDDAEELMHAMIERMFGLARRAVAFTTLSTWGTDPVPGEFYADPLRLVDWCRTLTPWVTLRHDYHPADFAVYLYREQR